MLGNLGVLLEAAETGPGPGVKQERAVCAGHMWALVAGLGGAPWRVLSYSGLPEKQTLTQARVAAHLGVHPRRCLWEWGTETGKG